MLKTEAFGASVGSCYKNRALASDDVSRRIAVGMIRTEIEIQA